MELKSEQNQIMVDPPAQNQTFIRRIGFLAMFFYGVAVLLPIAPVPVFGILADVSKGHVALAYLVAMIVMVFSAWTFGIMGGEFPVAGSSYSFVTKSINPYLGFLTGWAILVDYLLLPAMGYMVFGLYVNALFPALPFNVVLFCAVALLAIINLLGIKSLTKVNNIITIFGFLVCFYFLYAAFGAMSHGMGTGFSSVALYNPATFSYGSILAGASIAVFSYVGFDVMTTIAEEVIEPKKTLPKATVTVCIVMGIIFTIFAFASSAVFPGLNFSDPNVAFIDVAKAAGGATLANAISLAMLAGSLAFCMDMLAAVSRLMFGMGRDGVIPKKIFGYISPKTGVPVWNIIIISLLSLVLSQITLDTIIPLINFGALFAYSMVNLSCIVHFYFKSNKRKGWDLLKYMILPGIGFVSTVVLWLYLDSNAKIVGFIWLAIGLVYLVILTKGFRKPMIEMDI